MSMNPSMLAISGGNDEPRSLGLAKAMPCTRSRGTLGFHTWSLMLNTGMRDKYILLEGELRSARGNVSGN